MSMLLYAVIFGEMLVIVSFLFKTPLRKLVIIGLNRVKRGRGPVYVKTVTATVVVMFGSALYSIYKIRRGSGKLEIGTVVNPTDQVLVAKHTLEASLLGFVLFLSLIIDRLHHYIRELRLLRKHVEVARKQSSTSFEDSKKGSAVENKALKDEIEALRSKVKKLESECEVKGSRANLEADVVALKKQSEGLLIQYDRILNRFEGI